MMTREDMLRELELLPVWQLRTPLAEPALKIEKLVEIQPVEIATERYVEKSASEKPLSFSPSEAKPLSFSEAELEISTPEDELKSIELNDASDAESIVYQCIASDDNAYLFILPSDELNEDAAILQRNIWRAMRLNVKTSTAQNLDAIAFANHKIIITMGEGVAQQLLATNALLNDLRGSMHQFKGLPLIATFDATYLLQNPQYKPQAWADLCLGMQTLLNLNNDKS